VVPEHSGAGVVREPAGTTVTGIVPTNTYRCADGAFIVIGGNNNSIYKRLMQAADRPDLAEHPEMQDNAGRVTHQREIDAAIQAWTASLESADALAALQRSDVPSAGASRSPLPALRVCSTAFDCCNACWLPTCVFT